MIYRKDGVKVYEIQDLAGWSGVGFRPRFNSPYTLVRAGYGTYELYHKHTYLITFHDEYYVPPDRERYFRIRFKPNAFWIGEILIGRPWCKRYDPHPRLEKILDIFEEVRL